MPTALQVDDDSESGADQLSPAQNSRSEQCQESDTLKHHTSSATVGTCYVSAPHRRATKIVHSVPFELAVGIVTLCNLTVVVIETNKRADCYTQRGSSEEDCSDVGIAWRLVNILFLLIYVIEIAARFYVDRDKFIKNWWNLSDIMIVSLSGLAEVFQGVFPSMGFLRMFRTVRLLRTVRIAIMQRELYLLVHGFVSTMKALLWAAILMIGLLTMWSILAVEVLHPINQDVALYTDDYEDCNRCSRSFASVWDANITFFNTVVLGDGWADFILPIVDRRNWTLVIFMGVSFSVGLGLVNLILAVIVDRAREAHEEDVDHQNNLKQQKMENAKKTISKMFSKMDADKNGNLSLDELLSGYEESDELRQVLNVLDVEKDDIECVFRIMDADGSGDVSYQEFVDNLYRMKSHNSRTLLVFIKFYVLELRRNVQEELALIKGEILGSLNKHTHMLAELKGEAARDSPKSLLHQEARNQEKDHLEEVVSSANSEMFAAASTVTVLHPHTINEIERCVDQVMSSDALLRRLAAVDGLQRELAVAPRRPEEILTERSECARSEVLQLPGSIGHAYLEAKPGLLLRPVEASIGQAAKESTSQSLTAHSVPGPLESDCFQQPTGSPPELEVQTDKLAQDPEVSTLSVPQRSKQRASSKPTNAWAE